MNEYDSPNYTENSYEKRAEGKTKLLKIILIFAYILFLGAFFLVCYITKLIPLFALAPLFLWMLVYFTWRLVSFDVYYTFNHGEMTFGKYKIKKGVQRRRPTFTVRVKEAILIAPLDSLTPEEKQDVRRTLDYSSSHSAKNLIAMIFERGGRRTAVIFDGTKRASQLLASFSPAARGLKEMEY